MPMAFDPKVCVMCGRTWIPTTRYQAARNKTCGPTCTRRAVSAAKAGKPTGRRVAWITLTCTECGKTFERTPAWVRQGTAEPTCSRQCNGARRGREWATHGHKGRAGWTDASRTSYLEKMTGERNPAWKGGVTYKRPHGNHAGARYVRCPAWALTMARKDGYVMEHRLVVATMAGYVLTRTEVVHHRDHDALNNRPTNLELWPDNRSHKLAEHGRFVVGAACRTSLAALGLR
jgi:hypothetical protein